MPQDKKQIKKAENFLTKVNNESSAAKKPNGLIKPKPLIKMSEDEAFSKRSGIPLSEIKAQGGVTPKDVIDQIKKTGGYFTKYGPGANKKPKSKF